MFLFYYYKLLKFCYFIICNFNLILLLKWAKFTDGSVGDLQSLSNTGFDSFLALNITKSY
jgi:hypothetical protein